MDKNLELVIRTIIATYWNFFYIASSMYIYE